MVTSREGDPAVNDYMISPCSPIQEGGCTDRSGEWLHPYVCEIDKLSKNGSDAGSILSFDDSTSHLRLVYRSISDEAPLCSDGTRQTT